MPALLLLASLVVATAQAPADTGRTALLTAPPHEGGPLPIDIGFHVVDFGRITAREESFEATIYLEMRWRDRRLADASAEGPWVPTRKIWIPRITFDNAADAPRAHGEPTIEVDPEGVVTYESILSGRFSAPLDLRAFPFDSQVLPIRISLLADVSAATLRLNGGRSRIHDDAFVTDWILAEPKLSVEEHAYSPGEPGYSSLLHEVAIHRRATFYVWRVLLPLTLLPLVSFVIFWFDPAQLQPQISTCMATLISLVTFHFAVDFALPKVTYLTLVDRQALVGFLLVAVEVGFVGLVHLAIRGGRTPRAERLQRIARVAFPAAYLAAVVLNLAVGLHHGAA